MNQIISAQLHIRIKLDKQQGALFNTVSVNNCSQVSTFNSTFNSYFIGKSHLTFQLYIVLLSGDREIVGNTLEKAYPRSFLTRVDSILSFYIEERDFSISASVQNLIPKDKTLLLQDTITVSYSKY